jgi:hypothetical protein
MQKTLLHRRLSFRTGSRRCTDAFGPDAWFGGRDLLHRGHIAGTTSQHNFLPGTTSTFAGHLSGCRWHWSDLTIHPVVRSARRSLSFEGELSGKFLIIRQRIINGALVCHSSQREIFIRPSVFCTWGCGRGCLSLLSAVSTFSRMGPVSWSFSCYVLRAAGSQPDAATTAIDRTSITSSRSSTLWQLVHSSRHGHCERASELLISALTVLGSEVVLLELRRWIQLGGLSLEVLKTHKPG